MRRCKHCNAKGANRPRGLCWVCYYNPDVRDRFANRNPYLENPGVGLDERTRPLPAEPTRSLPGSPAKVEVLRERARAGVQLFHPLDAGTNPDAVPADATNSMERWDAEPKRHGRRARVGTHFGRTLIVKAGDTDFEDEISRRLERADW